MPFHDLRSRVHRAPLIGTTVAIPSPTVVEALAPTSVQLLCIDAEHAPLGIEALEAMLRAADVRPIAAIVRVPEPGHYIARVLDLGAAGIVVPRIESAAEALDVVQRARYAPEGRRGAGTSRAQTYGAGLVEYVRRANDELLVAIQIESAAGLAAADEILAVPGIDAVVIGPFDLATSMGVAMGSAGHREAIAEIFAAADRHGVAKGAFVFDTAEVPGYLEQGATLLLIGMDLVSVVAGAEAMWDALPFEARAAEAVSAR